MSSNRHAKNELIRLYGAECFIDKLKLRPLKEKTVYTGKAQRKRMEEFTYHHICKKAERRKGNSRKWCITNSR